MTMPGFAQPTPPLKPKKRRVPWTAFEELDRKYWEKLYTERYGAGVVSAVGSDGVSIVPDRVFENSRYTVFWCEVPAAKGWPPMITLSIKHRERHPMRDWRDLQRIKNEIVGSDHEAVELFPNEDRLMDTANQAHLWILKTPGMKFPFGFTKRMVADGDGELTKLGTRQEPMENPPDDVVTASDMIEMHDVWADQKKP